MIHYLQEGNMEIDTGLLTIHYLHGGNMEIDTGLVGKRMVY